jgi:hypothetical protein
MNMISVIAAGANGALDGLRAEFGAVLAERIFEAEAADFLWITRIREHYLGEYACCECGDDWAGEELSRVAFLSFLDGRWHAGTCLIDGEGSAVELLWKRQFGSRSEAEIAFDRAR